MSELSRNKLLTLIGGVLLSAVVLVVVLLLEERTRVLRDADFQLETITNSVAEQYSELSAQISNIRNAIQPDLTRLELRGYDSKVLVEESLANVAKLDAHLIELVVFDRAGAVIASSSGAKYSPSELEPLRRELQFEPRFLPPQRLKSGLSSGRTVNIVTIGLKNLEGDLSAGLALIFDQEKYNNIFSAARVYRDVNVTVFNREGDVLIARKASAEEESDHQHSAIEREEKPRGTDLLVQTHRSLASVLADNWNQLALLVGAITFVLVLLSILALWRLAVVDRSRTEAKLVAERRLQRLNAIFKAAPDAILSVSASSIIQSANKSAADLFGYTVEGLIGRPIETLIPEQFQRVHKLHVERFLTNPESQTATMGDWRRVHCVTATGKEVPILASLGRLSDEEDSDTVVMIRDMSDAKVADDSLRQLSFELARELEAAKEADRAKSSFLAQMSHELRTPLNAIIGFSEAGKLEQFGTISPRVYRDYAEDIHRSGLHLLSLVNDILDFSKIDANKQDLALEAIQVRPMLLEAIKVLQPLASEGNVRLRFRNTRLFDQLTADRRAVHQCLLNLLSNAIRHSRSDGKVLLELVETPDTVEIHVIDSGAGISEENLQKIGKPFEQFENPMTSSRKGTGLGLAITKSLMELMQGRLEIESAEGIGTTAKLVFPIRLVTE